MITHCLPKQPSTSPVDHPSESTQALANSRPLPQVPLLSPKPVRAKPTLPPKLSNTDVLNFLSQAEQNTPISPSLLSLYSDENSTAHKSAVNEDVYRTNNHLYSSAFTTTERARFEEDTFINTSLVSEGHSEGAEKVRRKELPSPPSYKQRNNYTYGHTTAPVGEHSIYLLAEEVNTEKSDITAFIHPQSAHLQDAHNDCQDPATSASKYGTLGKTRSTKPLPKPRSTSGALEQTQSELKRAYFQVNSLQMQLVSQQTESKRLKKELERHEATQSKLSLEIQQLTQNEIDFKKELSDMNEEMRLMRLENKRLSQENDKYSIEGQKRAEILNKQVNCLKVELIKSATFANSAINQISMGITNVNQIMEYLNGLGKISTEDQ